MDQVILLAARILAARILAEPILAERIPFGAAALPFSSLVVARLRLCRNEHDAAPRLNAGVSILWAQQKSAMGPA